MWSKSLKILLYSVYHRTLVLYVYELIYKVIFIPFYCSCWYNSYVNAESAELLHLYSLKSKEHIVSPFHVVLKSPVREREYIQWIWEPTVIDRKWHCWKYVIRTLYVSTDTSWCSSFWELCVWALTVQTYVCVCVCVCVHACINWMTDSLIGIVSSCISHVRQASG